MTHTTEPNLDELRQKIYDVLNVHTPAGCAGRHCWGVEALEKLISDQVAKARIEEAKLFNRYFDDNQAFKGFAEERLKELGDDK